MGWGVKWISQVPYGTFLIILPSFTLHKAQQQTKCRCPRDKLSLSILTFMSKQTAGSWEIPSVCRGAGLGEGEETISTCGGKSH